MLSGPATKGSKPADLPIMQPSCRRVIVVFAALHQSAPAPSVGADMSALPPLSEGVS